MKTYPREGLGAGSFRKDGMESSEIKAEEGGSSSERLNLTNDSLSKLVTGACGLCLFALGGRWVGLYFFLYLTVNGWPGPPMFFPSSLCCPLVSASGMAPHFFFFLQLKVCKQESRGLKPAQQRNLSVDGGRGVGVCPCIQRPLKGHPDLGYCASVLA